MHPTAKEIYFDNVLPYAGLLIQWIQQHTYISNYCSVNYSYYTSSSHSNKPQYFYWLNKIHKSTIFASLPIHILFLYPWERIVPKYTLNEIVFYILHKNRLQMDSKKQANCILHKVPRCESDRSNEQYWKGFHITNL